MSSVLGVDNQPRIFLGVWINWSKGNVLGSTLTVTQTNGALLVAFVALFVTFAGTRLWRISCFFFHRGYSASGPQDGIYHQRQAVLKNSDNATAGLISWYLLLRAWRKIGHRPYRRMAPIALFTIMLAVSVAAASLLSSRISSAMGQEVLIRGECGVNLLGHYIAGQDKNPEVETSPEFFTVLLPFLSRRLISFSNYALSCYANNSDSRGCNTFVKSRLPFTSNRTANCPFQQDICRLSNGNILLDTGYLNSHVDMGFNAPVQNRFFYRRTTHCAPLVTEGYKSIKNSSESGAKSSYAQYSYGQPLSSSDTQENVTYIYPQLSVTDMFGENKSRTNIPEYTLGYVYANVINGSLAHNRAFTPIDELYRSDADVSVFFLSSNQVISPVEIHDPWYSAHQAIPGFHLNFTGWNNLTLGGYFGDEPAAVLGCAKQYQICYPDKAGKPSQCSRLGGKQELYWLLTSLTQNEEQLNRTRWSIMSALTGNELDAFVQTLGAASLTSRYSLVSGIQGPLPDNQWQVDVEHWHAATMVAIQGSAVDAASGPSNPDMRKFWAAPSNDQERSVCNSQVSISFKILGHKAEPHQKVLSDAHSNFSVFGLALTFALGGLVITISFIPDRLAGLLRKKHDRDTYSRLEWCVNDTLQLQRLAHEGQGCGTWSACTRSVPTTYGNETLALLDVTDVGHPVLKGSSPGLVVEAVKTNGSEDQMETSEIEHTEEVGLGANEERDGTGVESEVVQRSTRDEEGNGAEEVPEGTGSLPIERADARNE
ncbi:uncharacterized protein N0V89_005050 [Didymosphaeria variabile]|uniref:Uncharacterized protein n=1 Tax=Didymosphaeria variabile TaxID=1932322 RepID=A0A9W8XK36_9PLEO|nr:uncharacterized protein N0V89_005050 [Didymosphaeria variabile]KAJ4353322.1 hypothetical protein N0V89_005050 [Didymosphaeria variabile]